MHYQGRDLEAMGFADNYHRWILSWFRPYLRGAVAEVGAGVGTFSKLLLETGIESLHCFEPSEDMFHRLARALSGDARVTTSNAGFRESGAAGAFDAIVYVNVLEHIRDDVEEISYAREALDPDGHLLLFVPALPRLYSSFDAAIGHWRRYTKSQLLDRVHAAGFVEISIRYFDLAGVIPWFVNFVVLRNTIRAGGVAAYDRYVVPLMRAVEARLSPPVGKNLLLVARPSRR